MNYRALIDELHISMRNRMSDKRYKHCENVSLLCRDIALREGYDVDKAELVGFAHDIAKELSSQQSMGLLDANNIPLNQYERDNLYLIHGIVGAIILQTEYGVQDSEILNAVRYHIGRPAMTQLEKIVFLADHIDKGNRMGIDTQCYLEEPDIDIAVMKLLRGVLDYYISRDIDVEEITYNTFDYMLSEIQNKAIKSSEQQSELSDESFDEALMTQLKHRIPVSSLKNARDLGGTINMDGRAVRKNMILRAARLCTISKEDAHSLKEMGISHVIDLRTEEEIEKNPDINVEEFIYVSCSLPSIELSNHQKLLQNWFQRSKNEQQTWYLSEYMESINMKDMYARILKTPESISNIQRVFETLLSSECSGAIFHCTSGKDRTGIIAMLIYSILMCEYEDMRNDYQASALHTYTEMELLADDLMEFGYKESLIHETRYYCGIGGDMFDYIQQYIGDEFGSMDNYISNVLNLTSDMLSQFREKYLEPLC